MNKQLLPLLLMTTVAAVGVIAAAVAFRHRHRLAAVLDDNRQIARHAVGQVEAVSSGQMSIHYPFGMDLLILVLRLLLEQGTDERGADREEEGVGQQVHVPAGVGLRTALCHVAAPGHCETRRYSVEAVRLCVVILCQNAHDVAD